MCMRVVDEETFGSTVWSWPWFGQKINKNEVKDNYAVSFATAVRNRCIILFILEN